MWKPAYDFLLTWAAHVGDSYRDVIQELHHGLDKMRNPITKRWKHLTGALILVNCLDTLRSAAFCPSGYGDFAVWTLISLLVGKHFKRTSGWWEFFKPSSEMKMWPNLHALLSNGVSRCMETFARSPAVSVPNPSFLFCLDLDFLLPTPTSFHVLVSSFYLVNYSCHSESWLFLLSTFLLSLPSGDHQSPPNNMVLIRTSHITSTYLLLPHLWAVLAATK